VEGIVELARDLRIELAIIGPEAPLVAGVADALRRAGVLVFGPGAAAARIEGSKLFAKEIMKAAGVRTAATMVEPIAPCVIKADGLAAGKGVFVCPTQSDVEAARPKARSFGGPLVIEELLIGDEVSLLAVADGERAIALPAAQDYKRAGDGDTGPNTGGMGAYSPVTRLDAKAVEGIVDSVHRPVLAELARRGAPFIGCLYAGLMMTDDGFRVLEFNCRLGDPETQVVLPRLESDFLELALAAATGDLSGVEVTISSRAAVTVAIASRGYPDSVELGVEISGIAAAEQAGAIVFQAGTALRDGTLRSAGGRVLNVTALGKDLEEAREIAYRGVERISMPGMQFRRDIAAPRG
jgi:phosphoribosylamine--glycine ligase